MNDPYRKQNTNLLLASIVCMAIALRLRADIALQQATAPALAGHASAPKSLPARAGAAGYIEVWAALADADDERTLVQIIGAPALAVGPRVRPGLRRVEI
jgi:hypothetical protein